MCRLFKIKSRRLMPAAFHLDSSFLSHPNSLQLLTLSTNVFLLQIMVQYLLITANVGSLFEPDARLHAAWVKTVADVSFIETVLSIFICRFPASWLCRSIVFCHSFARNWREEIHRMFSTSSYYHQSFIHGTSKVWPPESLCWYRLWSYWIHSKLENLPENFYKFHFVGSRSIVLHQEVIVVQCLSV